MDNWCRPNREYVLRDLYSWLESHSGLSHPYVTTTSMIGANTSSLNTNTTSPGSSSSKSR
jgi:hypothetical protein